MSDVIEFPKQSVRAPTTSDNQDIEHLKFQLKLLEEEILSLSQVVTQMIRLFKQRGK